MLVSTLNCTGYGVSGTLMKDGSNNAFISYAVREEIDMNGRFCSFDLKKTDTYSETNSDISVYFNSLPNAYDYIGTSSGELFGEEVELPVIEKVNEYIIGDADGNWYVSATDASTILKAVSDNGDVPISVPLIESHFTRLFPSAKAPAAPDADRDGYITEEDAKLVLHHYSSVSSGGDYVGAIGSKDFYEYYNC